MSTFDFDFHLVLRNIWMKNLSAKSFLQYLNTKENVVMILLTDFKIFLYLCVVLASQLSNVYNIHGYATGMIRQSTWFPVPLAQMQTRLLVSQTRSIYLPTANTRITNWNHPRKKAIKAKLRMEIIQPSCLEHNQLSTPVGKRPRGHHGIVDTLAIYLSMRKVRLSQRWSKVHGRFQLFHCISLCSGRNN